MTTLQTTFGLNHSHTNKIGKVTLRRNSRRGPSLKHRRRVTVLGDAPPLYSPPVPSAPPPELQQELLPSYKSPANNSPSSANKAANNQINRFVIPKLFPGSKPHPYDPLYTLSPTNNLAKHPLYPKVQKVLDDIMKNDELEKGLYAFKVPGSLDYYFAKKLGHNKMGTVYKIPSKYQQQVKTGNNFLEEKVKFIGDNKNLNNQYVRAAKLNILHKHTQKKK